MVEWQYEPRAMESRLSRGFNNDDRSWGGGKRTHPLPWTRRSFRARQEWPGVHPMVGRVCPIRDSVQGVEILSESDRRFRDESGSMFASFQDGKKPHSAE